MIAEFYLVCIAGMQTGIAYHDMKGVIIILDRLQLSDQRLLGSGAIIGIVPFVVIDNILEIDFRVYIQIPVTQNAVFYFVRLRIRRLYDICPTLYESFLPEVCIQTMARWVKISLS